MHASRVLFAVAFVALFAVPASADPMYRVTFEGSGLSAWDAPPCPTDFCEERFIEDYTLEFLIDQIVTERTIHVFETGLVFEQQVTSFRVTHWQVTGTGLLAPGFQGYSGQTVFSATGNLPVCCVGFSVGTPQFDFQLFGDHVTFAGMDSFYGILPHQRDVVVLLTLPDGARYGWQGGGTVSDIAPVPEPSALGLLTMGGLALWGARRTRQRST